MIVEGTKGVGGKVGVEEDMGDGMQCSYHPYRNNPGGICAFCLQEKLGRLVSSSFPLPIRPSSSSSSSPSFRSDIAPTASASSSSVSVAPTSSTSLSLSLHPTSAGKHVNGKGRDCHYHEYYTRRARIPFLSAKKKKKKAALNSNSSDLRSVSSTNSDVVFKRSKSIATPRRTHFLDDEEDEDDIVIEEFSPTKRNGFWSFLYLSSKPTSSSSNKSFKAGNNVTRKSKPSEVVIVEEDDSPSATSQAPPSASSFERKVSRSRSVGCGSRSFSGDFFERISTGFGDCTLRRVESQREGKPKSAAMNGGGNPHPHHGMKERVRCGGIFGGFMMTSSSSSSSSSSYWVSSSVDDQNNMGIGKPTSVVATHGRNKNWAWSLASPMRAFSSKPSSSSSKDNKRDIIRQASDKNASPNLAAIPSLLAVRV